jgi:hypothetical protein
MLKRDPTGQLWIHQHGNPSRRLCAAPLAGPFAEVGRQTFDGKGKTDATANLSTNGNPATVTIAGTYAVNPDCTGSMTLNVSPFDFTVHAYFVIDDDGAEVSSHRHRPKFDREPCLHEAVPRRSPGMVEDRGALGEF